MRKALGKGIEALIPKSSDLQEENIIFIPVDKIKSNKNQPRSHFDENKINELVLSVKEKGIVQPVIVSSNGIDYSLIAGERRLLAAKKAGLDKIPAIVKKVSDIEALELSLIENLQREDLNPIEEALAYKKLNEQFNLTQHEISKKVGKSRTVITNMLRLLSLPEPIKEKLISGAITISHARTILTLKTEKEQLELLDKILKQGYTVRKVEKTVSKKKKKKEKLPEIAHLEESLQRIFGTKLRIQMASSGKGKIEISFYSLDDLERIVALMKRHKDGKGI